MVKQNLDFLKNDEFILAVIKSYFNGKNVQEAFREAKKEMGYLDDDIKREGREDL